MLWESGGHPWNGRVRPRQGVRAVQGKGPWHWMVGERGVIASVQLLLLLLLLLLDKQRVAQQSLAVLEKRRWLRPRLWGPRLRWWLLLLRRCLLRCSTWVCAQGQGARLVRASGLAADLSRAAVANHACPQAGAASRVPPDKVAREREGNAK